MGRIKDVQVAVRKPNRPKKALTIDAETALLLRKVARAEGYRMTDFLDRALRAYLEKYHPDWGILEETAKGGGRHAG
jgi:hypothetical protein